MPVRGTVEIEVIDGIAPEYLRASEKSPPEEQWDQIAEQVRGIYPQMARITIVPAWAKMFDFSRGGCRASLSVWLRSVPDGKQRSNSNHRSAYWARRTADNRRSLAPTGYSGLKSHWCVMRYLSAAQRERRRQPHIVRYLTS